MSDPIINDITIAVTGTIDSSMTISLDTSGLVVVDTTPIPPEPTLPPEPTPGPRGKLSVKIAYKDKVHSFNSDNGIDLGDFVTEYFTQGCLLVTNEELPGLTVQFRSDKGGQDRNEVVFEFGDTTVGTTAFNMEKYIASIYVGDDMVAEIPVPYHYWYSRWRWQSAPRPIITDIADLQANGLLPYFDASLAEHRPLSPQRTYTPMGLAGLTAYMPSTGERDEIGLVTEAQAEYITGSVSNPSSLFAQAEASGTWQWHYRDEEGGGLFDFKTHPQATVYWPANIPTTGSPLTLDVAHEPALAFVPYMLTNDPYYLEELQFAATYNVLCSNAGARGNFNIGHAVRAHAWSLRVLVQCATITPETVPVWLKPRSYWKDWFDQERGWMLNRYVNPTAEPFISSPYANFHFMSGADGTPASNTIPANTANRVFMEDMEGTVLAYVVMLGHEDWRPILEWKMYNTISRTNGTSGWVRAKPAPYDLVLRLSDKSPYAATWAECWDFNLQLQPTIGVYPDEDTIPPEDGMTYSSYCMSSLAIAAQLEIVGAEDCYTWLSGQIRNNSKSGHYIDRKWTMIPR
jgi:hypothetical protein